MHLDQIFFLGIKGDGDELITPVYLPPTRPPWTRVEYDDEDENNYNRKYAGRLCRGQNDEEDCINGSSGDGDEFIPGSGKIRFKTIGYVCYISIILVNKIMKMHHPS